MRNYHELLEKIIRFGTDVEDRTGVGTRTLFGERLEFGLRHGNFPLLATKKTNFNNIANELLWFIRGEDNINWLKERGTNIWNPWAQESGDVGRIYGVQWRKWKDHSGVLIDQLGTVIKSLKTNLHGRRHIVSAWNAGDVHLERMALPPCHVLFQFFGHYEGAEKYLSCQVYQRSCDSFVGLPYNIASYSLLTYMIAHLIGAKPARLIWVGGDVHVYHNHLMAVQRLLERSPDDYPSPKLRIGGTQDIKTIDDFKLEHFILEGYNSAPFIPVEVAI